MPKVTKSQEDARVRSSSKEPASRANRAATADAQRTTHDGTALTTTERQRLLRSEFQQESLPTAPPIPGWHLCWLNYTSSYDPIHKRLRMGYVPVKPEEVKGLGTSFNVKSGELAGMVVCNEMVLFKIPQDIYEEIMQEFHHNMPFAEEESIKRALKQGHKDPDGKDLEEVEGFEDLADPRKRRAPSFSM